MYGETSNVQVTQWVYQVYCWLLATAGKCMQNEYEMACKQIIKQKKYAQKTTASPAFKTCRPSDTEMKCKTKVKTSQFSEVDIKIYSSPT